MRVIKGDKHMEEEKEINSEEQEKNSETQDLDVKSLKDFVDALCNDLNMLSKALDLISKLEDYKENLYEKYEEYLDSEKKFQDLSNKIDIDDIRNKIEIFIKEDLLEKIEKNIEKGKEDIEKEKENFDSFKNAYGARLEETLKAHNLTLKGNYPIFKISYFTIQAKLNKSNMSRYKCTIWYGPKIEKIGECSMVPSKLVKRIEEIINNLGLRRSEDEIFALFKEIYLRMSENLKIKEIPIIEFYKEIVSKLGESVDHNPNNKEELTNKYSIVSFSFDLYRLYKKNYPIKLRIATREFTKNKNTHLWVPSDDKGNGSNYSHISILDIGGEVIE